MMCWEATNNFPEEEPHKEPEKVEKKPVEKMEKPKHEQEHVKPTLNKGNRLKILIEEFSWEREDDGSILDMEELEQQQSVYIMNLKNGLQKMVQNCTMKKAQMRKSLQQKIGLLKSPP